MGTISVTQAGFPCINYCGVTALVDLQIFVPRDVSSLKISGRQTFFLAVGHRPTAKKKVRRPTFHGDLTSRGTKVYKKRNSIRSGFRLQGSTAAEHPIKARGGGYHAGE